MEFRVCLFGRIEISHNLYPVDLKSRKAQALLAYLAVTQRAHSRDRLAVLFWPEADEKRARNSLSRTLYQLKQTALGDDLDANGDKVQLNVSAIEVDVNQFNALMRQWQQHKHTESELCAECTANLMAAVDLYGDDFLADFYLADANEFEEWSAAQRERLRRMTLDALDALAETSTGRGEFDQARRFARRQLEIEDLRESAVRLLLESLARSGHRREALAEFERFKQHLWSEMAVDVTAATQVLAADIRAGKFDPQPEPKAALQEQMAVTTSSSTDRRSLSILLDKVESLWVEGVLENSLHGAALIELGKELRPGEVDYPWGLVMQRPGGERYELPAGLSMADVFDDNGQALLILGEPGSGKTTMMLDLARTMIARAQEDGDLPIPVVFNLSSWRGSRLLDWLILELNEKYLIPRKIGRKWLLDDQLLLLFDGLDEVAAERRAACVSAINVYRQDHGFVPLVVCSRVEAYEPLAVRLKLENAILLQPLSDGQIARYFEAAGGRLQSVQQLVEEDEQTRELARSPLMLSVLSLAYQGVEKGATAAPTAAESSRDRLFSAYVRRMFERRGRGAKYSEAQTLHWLSWLAWATKRQGESLFLIERLQPSWLARAGQQKRYILFSRIAAMTLFLLSIRLGIAVAFNAVQSSFAPWIHLPEQIMFHLTAGILMGTLLAVVYWLWAAHGRRPAPTGSSDQATHVWRQIGSFVVVLICGIVTFWLVNGLNIMRSFSLWPRLFDINNFWGMFSPSVLRSLDFIGLLVFSAVIFGLRGAERSLDNDIRAVETLRWSWRNALIGGLVMGLLILVIALLLTDLSAVDRLQQILYIVGFGVVLGVVFLGNKVGILEIRVKTNQGMRLSWRYAWRYALLILAAAFIYGLVANIILFPPSLSLGLADRLVTLVGLLPYFAIGAFYWFGGLELIYHFCLRVMLWRVKAAPLDYPQFLDYAAQLLFLRKVGGGYTFSHELLREHFAQEVPQPRKVVTPWVKRWRVPVLVILLLILGWVALTLTYQDVRDDQLWEGSLPDPLAGSERPLVAGDVNCALRSIIYKQETQLTFLNHSQRTLGVYWRTYEGGESYYGPLPPGGRARFASVADTMAFCLRDLQTGEPVLGYTISPDSPLEIIVPP